MMAAKLTQERVKELFSYNPETGEFVWRVPLGTAKAGQVAGNVDPAVGYRRIRVENVMCYAHRLAWLYMTGHWPATAIDHVDGDRANNAWVNLRAASQTENMRNTRKRKDNKSGFKGVSWCSDRSLWTARIKDDDKYHYLGRFATKEEAAQAYRNAARKLFGEFARLE